MEEVSIIMIQWLGNIGISIENYISGCVLIVTTWRRVTLRDIIVWGHSQQWDMQQQQQQHLCLQAFSRLL